MLTKLFYASMKNFTPRYVSYSLLTAATGLLLLGYYKKQRQQNDFQSLLNRKLAIQEKIEALYETLPVVFTEEEIESALDTMAKKIIPLYQPGEKIKLLCLLNGAKPITDALKNRLTEYEVEVIYTKPSSYRNKAHSQELQWENKPTAEDLNGTIVVVDDVLDTGKTMFNVAEYVKAHANKTHIVILVNKQQERSYIFDSPLIIGLNANKEDFILGRGMDYRGYFRTHKDIRAMTEPVLKQVDTLLAELNKIDEQLSQCKSKGFFAGLIAPSISTTQSNTLSNSR